LVLTDARVRDARRARRVTATGLGRWTPHCRPENLAPSIELRADLPQGADVSRDTRNRILVASLLLFNERGEPRTAINDIADEIDISPGNLHYHFRRKADIVDALLAEFRADAGKVLAPPSADDDAVETFWLFLHDLLECTVAYRFLFRDSEMLAVAYPSVARAMRHFARGLAAAIELHLRAMLDEGAIDLSIEDAAGLSRRLAVIALFSDRFDLLVEGPLAADEIAVRAANGILATLAPLANGETAAHLERLARHYR